MNIEKSWRNSELPHDRYARMIDEDREKPKSVERGKRLPILKIPKLV